MAKKLRKINGIPARSKTRNEVLDVYSNYRIKDAAFNALEYENVQEMQSLFYAGIDPRRKVEMAEGGMVKEDRQAMANLSPYGYQKQYPRAGYNSNIYIQDTFKEEQP